jgi:hypothetical protein
MLERILLINNLLNPDATSQSARSRRGHAMSSKIVIRANDKTAEKHLVDTASGIAHTLRIRHVTHPGKEKLTKKKIQDFIDARFNSIQFQIPSDVKIHGLKDFSILAEGLGLTKT